MEVEEDEEEVVVYPDREEVRMAEDGDTNSDLGTDRLASTYA
jgi:hypothetical protein